MSIPGSASPLFFTAAADAAAFTLEKSVRFNSGDSAYLNRTPSSAGSNTTWTLSTWVKKTGNDAHIFGAGAGNTPGRFGLTFDGSDKINVFVVDSGSTVYSQNSDAVFRDPSAWYHIVVIADTTNSTAADRLIVYVNGVRQTLSGGAMPSSQNTFVNTTAAHTFGRRSYTASDYFNGYLASTILVDGTAKDETDFGAFDDNGVWQAKAYNGSFGTNGFHLFDFANESGIGNDSSGNDNDFTVNNLTASVPSIASPNRPTWNGSVGSNWTRSNSNYDADYSGSGYTAITAALSASTTYHFYLNFKDGGGSYGGWFFSSTSTAPSNTVPDELGGNSLGLRTGESSLGTYGTYATANGTSNTQNQINVSALNSQSSGEYNIEFVVNTTAGKVWAKKPSDSGYVGGGDPTDSSSTASFLIPTGAQYFGYMGHSSNTFANFKTTAGNPEDLDVLRDVPTNGSTDGDTGAGGEVSGNYCTLNPLAKTAGRTPTLTNGNLNFGADTNSNFTNSVGTIPVSSGKWYVEYTIGSNIGSSNGLGFINSESLANAGGSYGIGQASDGWLRTTSVVYNNSSSAVSSLTSISSGDVVMLALDLDNGKAWWGRNGTFESSGNPGAGSNAMVTFTPGGKSFVVGISAYHSSVSASGVINFGARAFAYTAPSGFKALNTALLPTPTIANGRDHFDIALYTGNGGSSTITVSGLNFGPNLVWLKGRSDPDKHGLYDTVRGATKLLRPSSNAGESTQNGVTAFNSDGFDIGNYAETNGSSRTYVAWAWNVPGSASSNSDGTITSSVTKNADAGISIVTWTGDDSTGTIGHGLGSKPDLIIVKVYGDSSYADNWPVYSSVFDGTHYAYLNDTRKFTDFAGFWNDGTATSTVFPVGDYNTDNTKSLIAYCFTSVAGFSAFGSYEGTGSATDSPFIFTGMRPAFVLVKNADAVDDWCIADTTRSSHNVQDETLFPNSDNGEDTGSFYIDILSNGFKPRNTTGKWNSSGNTFIYAAFAENPFSSNGGLAR